MAFHKLADGPITLTIAAVEETEGKFGPQFRFDGEDGTSVYVSTLSGAQQLARANLTLETVVGKTLLFAQIRKDGKTFTNITPVAAGTVPNTVTGVAGKVVAKAATPTSTMTPAKAGETYGECLEQAIAVFGVKCEELGIAVDAQALHAVAATLFIKVTR